jgi:sec-independent protein translocase protein TatA
MIGDIMQPSHLLLVLVVALLVLGPKRLPEVGRQLGKGLRDFRAAINGEHTDHHDEGGFDHGHLSGTHQPVESQFGQEATEAAPNTQPATTGDAAQNGHEFGDQAAGPAATDHQFANGAAEPVAEDHEFAHVAAGPASGGQSDRGDLGEPTGSTESGHQPVSDQPTQRTEADATSQATDAGASSTAGEPDVVAERHQPADPLS